MKQIFFSIFLTLISGSIQSRSFNSFISSESGNMQKDSVTSLVKLKESYKLSGKNLIALAEKILYKKTPQGDMYMYLLRPAWKIE
jgi:hypothetical protein